MINVEYKGKFYAGTEVKLSNGDYFFYVEEAVTDAMEANNDWGCKLDENVCYYPTKDRIIGLDNLISSGANDQEIIDYCNDHFIYIGDYTR